jgi:hypothetical protein
MEIKNVKMKYKNRLEMKDRPSVSTIVYHRDRPSLSIDRPYHRPPITVTVTVHRRERPSLSIDRPYYRPSITLTVGITDRP